MIFLFKRNRFIGSHSYTTVSKKKSKEINKKYVFFYEKKIFRHSLNKNRQKIEFSIGFRSYVIVLKLIYRKLTLSYF